MRFSYPHAVATFIRARGRLPGAIAVVGLGVCACDRHAQSERTPTSQPEAASPATLEASQPEAAMPATLEASQPEAASPATLDAGPRDGEAMTGDSDVNWEVAARSCPVKSRWSLRIRRKRGPYAVEWRQCPKAVHDPVGDWDVDYLAVHDGAADTTPIVWSTTNAQGPTEQWLEQVVPTHFGAEGSEQLFVLTRIAGTGHAAELCELGAVGSGIGCWPEPRDLASRFEARLAANESMHNLESTLTEHGLEYRCGISRPGDPNCCPSGGVLRASAVAVEGGFVLGRVTRTLDE